MFSPNMLGLYPLTNRKSKTVLHSFNNIVNKSKRKSNKLWAD